MLRSFGHPHAVPFLGAAYLEWQTDNVFALYLGLDEDEGIPYSRGCQDDDAPYEDYEYVTDRVFLSCFANASHEDFSRPHGWGMGHSKCGSGDGLYEGVGRGDVGYEMEYYGMQDPEAL